LRFSSSTAHPSKEGDDRKEEKLNAILRKLDPENADTLIRKIDGRYPAEGKKG
jgi:hypothetical protein